MNILLTGSSGFVGSHFSSDTSIKRIVVRENDNCDHWECEQYTISALNGQTDWSGAFSDIGAIIHLAALAHSRTFTSDDYQQVNVDGALHLAREAALAGVKRFVFVSSIGVHGPNTFKEPFTPTSPLVPDNDYTRSKLSAEQGLKTIAKETGLEVVIVRPTLVYGADAPGNFGLLSKLIARVPFLPFGSIKNKRDFISAQNLADLLLRCATHSNASGHVFLASEGQTVSVGEFTNQIARGLNRKIIQFPVPAGLFRLAGRLTGKTQLVEQLVGNLHVDNSNLKQQLNWIPPYSMEEVMSQLNKGRK
ncbi:NAD-dependent epimerase/dehydratase family protein [Vibrio aestuarianus]|uniref:NAD-dependent epimerase/dehydratase family protein n=1 Tax=Vibrio aestuarianus TaxID=28171 RepID=UPI001559D949|nr:NAD-dependent epimerase/dehydratase family protein [Vibrio aestuarianus]NGZ15707.1 NAD-dependent epimerase/dehydratase family protein [Vibrio aestuarianus]NKZ51855.1 NAD-dependent epimerase/dehydratase family protein [Vibrio aestuarianus]